MTTPSTASTVLMFQTIRAHVLAFRTRSAQTPGNDLGERFWEGSAPVDDVFPQVVGRFINTQMNLGAARWRADLELYVFDRPLSRLAAAETIADRIVSSLQGYREPSSGFLMVSQAQRDTLPIPPAPGDRNLCQIRIVAEVIAYPTLLSQYSTP